MKRSYEVKLLEAIFSPAVDGNNSDAYGVVDYVMSQLPIEASKMSVSLASLRIVLRKLSKKWRKEIDEVISA